MKKVVGNARLSVEELETVLAELEGTLNTRHLTYEHDEVGAEMLTPPYLVVDFLVCLMTLKEIMSRKVERVY